MDGIRPAHFAHPNGRSDKFQSDDRMRAGPYRGSTTVLMLVVTAGAAVLIHLLPAFYQPARTEAVALIRPDAEYRATGWLVNVMSPLPNATDPNGGFRVVLYFYGPPFPWLIVILVAEAMTLSAHFVLNVRRSLTLMGFALPTANFLQRCGVRTLRCRRWVLYPPHEVPTLSGWRRPRCALRCKVEGHRDWCEMP